MSGLRGLKMPTIEVADDPVKRNIKRGGCPFCGCMEVLTFGCGSCRACGAPEDIDKADGLLGEGWDIVIPRIQKARTRLRQLYYEREAERSALGKDGVG
jgi:hypothetical protein